MAQPIGTATIRWFAAEDGGRSSPPPGPEYFATAVFGSGESAGPEVSIAIWFAEGGASTAEPKPAEIGVAAPELIAHALTPGAPFIVKEGPRTVAEGNVTALR